MTKLFERAIGKIRELSDADQDDAAELLLIVAARASVPEQLDDAMRAAVREGLAQARRSEFASDEEIAAIFDIGHGRRRRWSGD
jgi:predicted transcriptional regulator